MAATDASATTVSGLGALTCETTHRHEGNAPTATCAAHDGVFVYAGCVENRCNGAATAAADANVVATTPDGTLLCGTGGTGGGTNACNTVSGKRTAA